jgi:hypothetical protein
VAYNLIEVRSMDIAELKRTHKDEWVLAEVLEVDEEGGPKRGKLIKHSKDRDKIYRELSNVEEGKHICTLYTGEIPKEGYAVAFHSHG